MLNIMDSSLIEVLDMKAYYDVFKEKIRELKEIAKANKDG